MTETVSDERLRELAQGYETWSKMNSSRPQIDKDTASALRELLALRTPPQNTDGEAPKPRPGEPLDLVARK